MLILGGMVISMLLVSVSGASFLTRLRTSGCLGTSVSYDFLIEKACARFVLMSGNTPFLQAVPHAATQFMDFNLSFGTMQRVPFLAATETNQRNAALNIRHGAINLMLPTLAACGLLVFAGRRVYLRRRMRHEPNQCRSCGYDLTGNVTGRCPECGESTDSNEMSTL